MAYAISMWRDAQGFLHETQEAAENADAAFEVETRRAIVRSMLVERIRVTRGETGWPFAASGDLADWLIANWPTLKLIGFSFRVDDLAPAGEASLECASLAA